MGTMRSTASLLLIPGVLVLLYEPARWLLQTWTNPAYDSIGGWVALGVAALLTRSVLSGPAPADARGQRRAWALLIGCALTRLLGRLLALPILGAFALAFDVAALAILLRVERRPWPLSPWALAGMFALSLPVQFVVQRLVGFPLRHGATLVAQGVLSAIYPGIVREGTLITGPAAALSVDLPCSGARGLTLLLVLGTVLAARRSCGLQGALAGQAMAIAGALAGNALRIVGIYVAFSVGLDPSVEPLHSTIGLVLLAPSALPLLILARRWEPRRPLQTEALPPRDFRSVATALAFSAAALATALAPHRPVDVAEFVGTARLPRVLGERIGEPVPLSQQEQTFFARFGGEAEKMLYREPDGVTHTVLRVRTSAPLRHLHDPDVCLRAAGHTLHRLGVRSSPVPSILWKTRDPDGHAWRIEASFVSDDRIWASAASEAAWRWLFRPSQAWTLVERGSSWAVCETQPARCAAFERDLLSSLDLLERT